jgi:hypothetical protein
MTRKTIDCRTVPNDAGCTLAISGEPGELVTAAVQHAVAVHGHTDTSELREQLSSLMADEPAVSAPGAFVQLIEFDTDRIAEWDAIIDRWAAAIGAATPTRWPTPGIRPPERSSRNCSRYPAASRSSATSTYQAPRPTST